MYCLEIEIVWHEVSVDYLRKCVLFKQKICSHVMKVKWSQSESCILPVAILASMYQSDFDMTKASKNSDIYFFSIWAFFHWTFTNYRISGKGGDYF